MHFLETFYNKTIKDESINKFVYKNTKYLPALKKIILNFGCKNADIKQLAAGLLAFELIVNQRGKLTTTKHSNILFKIRKGNPTGCKITLYKFKAFTFLLKLTVEIFPKLKSFYGLIISKKTRKNIFSCTINETFSFQELENHYYLFNSLPKLNITVITNSQTKKELTFLLLSLKFPVK